MHASAPRTPTRRRPRAGVLLFALLLGWLLAGGARAVTINQTFMTNSAPGWVFGGSTLLTSGGADPAGQGWLRITPATGNQAGFAYYNTAFDTPDGFVIEFEYGAWGGTGADGFVVFLFDGAAPSFNIGDFGGSLGYANGCSPTPGLSRAYIGIAFDEFGNFTNPGDRCKNGGPGARANSVALRGEGNGVDNGTNYFYLTHNQLPVATQRIDCPSSLCGTARPAPATYYRQVRITIVPAGMTYTATVEMRFGVGDSYETVIPTFTLPTPIYPTVKIGFSASTGGSTNVHEIRNLRIDVFDTQADKQITGGFTGPLLAGGTAQYQVNVSNNGPDPEVGPLVVTSAIPAQLTYTGFDPAGSWGCSFSAPNLTCTHPGPLANGGSLAQLRLNFSVSPSAGGSNITMNASVSGSTFDLVPGNNTISSTRFVYGGATSGAKPMYMYFANAGANANTLRRIIPVADSTTVLPNGTAVTAWMPLTPAFVRPFTINAGSISVPICLQKPAGSSAQNRNVRVELDTVGATVVGLGGVTINNVLAPNDYTWRTVNFSVPLAAAVNLAAGTQIRVRVVNQSTGGGTRSLALRSFVAACGTGYSRVEVGSNTVINVDSVSVHSAAFPAVVPVASTFDDGGTLFLRALISDPFGSFDITGAEYDLFDGGNVQVAGPFNMTLVNDNVAAGQRTYQYPFTKPSFTGSVYTLRVTGREGTENPGVSHANATGLAVSPLPPLLSVSKVASTGQQAPGGTIGYAVNVANLGTGGGINIRVRDDLTPFGMLRINTYGPLPFQFVDGSPSSALAMGTPVYSNDNGATWTYVPVSGGGGAPAGYDANVTNFEVPMTGTMPPGGSFTLNYEVRVR